MCPQLLFNYVIHTYAYVLLNTQAHVQDPFNLKHMDTYARLLRSKEKLERYVKSNLVLSFVLSLYFHSLPFPFFRLSISLLYASSLHPQPWMAKAWQLTWNTNVDPTTRAKATTFALKVQRMVVVVHTLYTHTHTHSSQRHAH